MLKNCVFRADVDTRQWIHAAARRAVKTMAQTFIATIGTAAAMGEVNWQMVASATNWQMVASATVLSGILSVATSIAGLPELDAKA